MLAGERRSSYGDLHPASLGSIPACTHMSHWWWQEGNPAKLLSCSSKTASSVGMSEPLSEGVGNVEFRHAAGERKCRRVSASN